MPNGQPASLLGWLSWGCSRTSCGPADQHQAVVKDCLIQNIMSGIHHDKQETNNKIAYLALQVTHTAQAHRKTTGVEEELTGLRRP